MSRAVLLMAYGSPERPEDVASYFTHIRGGRTPSAESVRTLQRRYELVGGRTPLLEITNATRAALQEELCSTGEPWRVYIGMKHWHPFIADVVPRMVAEGVTEIVAVALAPHYSRVSIGGYRTAVDAALASIAAPVPLRFVDSWYRNDAFVDLIANRVRRALCEWPENLRRQVVTVFSAHSLPARIREWNDPYERQLLESCRAVAFRAGIDNWRFAWQSASDTGEPWLEPDIVEVLDAIHDSGGRHVLSVPIGFVSDHLEILYDIDHVAARHATSLAMTLRRTPMPNADPDFVRALASVVTAVQPEHVAAT